MAQAKTAKPETKKMKSARKMAEKRAKARTKAAAKAHGKAEKKFQAARASGNQKRMASAKKGLVKARRRLARAPRLAKTGRGKGG